ncbi:eCIS core domain-containing protein [Haliangium sp.]|uniref:eCIS core domain-containing protein n=1 Tax=Haliangium sp. TaxID=2663208 RepID=UPI003D108CFA
MSRAQEHTPSSRENSNATEHRDSKRVAPGKVTLSAGLSAGAGSAVQRKAAGVAAGAGAGGSRPTPRTAWELTNDPWMDTAHRGTAPPAVQAKGAMGAEDGDQVRRAASAGVSSGGGALPHLSAIQASFGAHDVGSVQAHVGGAAAEASASIGAEAYAMGERIGFRAQPDLHTAAHEAAHVVQQRAGVQLSGGVGRAGDSYERHADAVADAVVAGRSAEGLLAEMSGGGGAGAAAVQRFESHEHKVLGDEGTRTAQGQARTVEVAPGYFLTFGDLTAMAGDFFGSVAEIERIAANDGEGAGTREEIEYVRVVKVHGDESREESYSQAARDAVMARYYRLAGNNSSHFTEPNGVPERTSANNAGNYRDNHENAIRAAAEAAAAGESIDRALLCEGFASHYLTDAYAAGHVRTERISISEWWNPKVPMFWTNLRLLIAEEMAYHINDNTTIAGMLSVQDLWERVRAIIDAKDLPTLTFGDLVSGAVHDYDNEMGVMTQHGRLVGDAQLRDAQGNPIINPDTGAREADAVNTENLAIAAVRVSAGEVEQAYTLGATQTPDQVVAALRGSGDYAAEMLWPEALPQSQQNVPRPPWQQPDVASLIGDATMRQAIEIFAGEKADSLEDALTFEDAAGGLVSAELQAEGFRTRITGPLRQNPTAMLQRIIDYTPNTGGGFAGHDTDDNAMEYVGIAQNEGAMATLTSTQRTQLIRDMVAGVCGDDEEQAIIDLLNTTSVSEMEAIVTTLGGGDAEEGIDFLDSGVDGEEWDTLERVMRRSSVLARHL